MWYKEGYRKTTWESDSIVSPAVNLFTFLNRLKGVICHKDKELFIWKEQWKGRFMSFIFISPVYLQRILKNRSITPDFSPVNKHNKLHRKNHTWNRKPSNTTPSQSGKNLNLKRKPTNNNKTLQFYASVRHPSDKQTNWCGIIWHDVLWCVCVVMHCVPAANRDCISSIQLLPTAPQTLVKPYAFQKEAEEIVDT